MDHNPDFEVDWIAERQKANDAQMGVVRHATGDDDASNGHGGDAPSMVFEGIPLQLNLLGKPRTASESNAAAAVKEPKKVSSSAEKKKKKSSGKKEKRAAKKKSKSHKKRSKGSGSSSGSSSSSSSSDSDDSSNSGSSTGAEEERVKALLTLTKRSNPNLHPEQTSIRNQMRKMEPENNHNNDERRGEGERSSLRRRDSPDEYQESARRRRHPPVEDRGRSRSPGFDNRYRDRGRNKSRERQYRRRDSRSRSPAYRGGFRRRSRSRSRSSPRRIEKAVVNYPPQFKPRVQEKKAVEKKRTPPRKTPTAAALPGAKKLPFIGRMPVFKRQTGGLEAAAADGTTPERKEEEKPVKTPEKDSTVGEEKEDMVSQNDEDDLMPDPEQFERLMEKDRHEEQQREREQEQEQDILPPGIDESEPDLIPKPINDAPVPRRGPLPRDLEEALNIIFPGERPDGAQPERKPFVVTGHIKDNGTEIITGPEPEDEVSQNTAAMYQAFTAYQQQQPDREGEVLPPPPAEEESVPGEVVPDETGEVATVGQTEMDMEELAMLGIDASDLAAQCV